MKNTFGNSVTITLFGESHGEYIGAVIDGLAPGIEIDKNYIEHMLTLRRPDGKISTPRKEKDEFRIVSGFINGKTTGTPLTILIPNENIKSSDYAELKTVARPSHADYTAQCKYHGFQDSRGGGHFSGRITAALVAAGAICKSSLEKKDISKYKKKHLCGLFVVAIVSIVMSCVYTYCDANNTGGFSQNYVQTFDYILAIVIYLLVKYFVQHHETLFSNTIIRKSICGFPLCIQIVIRLIAFGFFRCCGLNIFLLKIF